MNRMDKDVEDIGRVGWMMVTSMMMMMIIRWWDLPHAWHCSPALIGWQQNCWARVQLHQHWASVRVVIIPTLIINWDPVKWLGQDGFVITGQTNIECDICPRLMSRFLCFCSCLTQCSYWEVGRGQYLKTIARRHLSSRLSTMWTPRTIDQVHWQMHYRQIPYQGHAKANRPYFSVLLFVGGIDWNGMLVVLITKFVWAEPWNSVLS